MRDSRVDPSDQHNQAIFAASQNGHFEVVKLLLTDNRVDPSDQHNMAVISASRGGHFEVVKLLLIDNRVDPSDQSNTVIIEASINGYTKIVKLLLTDNRVDPSDQHNRAIIAASLHGRLEVVKLLLRDSRVDPSDQHNEAILVASQNGHFEVVKLLMRDSRVDPSDQHNQAIFAASQNGHFEVVKLLLRDSRVDPSDQHNMAVISASRGGHFEVVKLLLEQSRVDPSDLHNSALINASRFGHVSVVHLLLSNSRVNPADKHHLALVVAARSGFFSIVKLLLDDPREQDSDAIYLAYILAFLKGHKEICNILHQKASVDYNFLLHLALSFSIRDEPQLQVDSHVVALRLFYGIKLGPIDFHSIDFRLVYSILVHHCFFNEAKFSILSSVTKGFASEIGFNGLDSNDLTLANLKISSKWLPFSGDKLIDISRNIFEAPFEFVPEIKAIVSLPPNALGRVLSNSFLSYYPVKTSGEKGSRLSFVNCLESSTQIPCQLIISFIRTGIWNSDHSLVIIEVIELENISAIYVMNTRTLSIISLPRKRPSSSPLSITFFNQHNIAILDHSPLFLFIHEYQDTSLSAQHMIFDAFDLEYEAISQEHIWRAHFSAANFFYVHDDLGCLTLPCHGIHFYTNLPPSPSQFILCRIDKFTKSTFDFASKIETVFFQDRQVELNVFARKQYPSLSDISSHFPILAIENKPFSNRIYYDL